MRCAFCRNSALRKSSATTLLLSGTPGKACEPMVTFRCEPCPPFQGGGYREPLVKHRIETRRTPARVTSCAAAQLTFPRSTERASSAACHLAAELVLRQVGALLAQRLDER